MLKNLIAKIEDVADKFFELEEKKNKKLISKNLRT